MNIPKKETIFPKDKMDSVYGCLYLIFLVNSIIYLKFQELTWGLFFQRYLPISIIALFILVFWYFIYDLRVKVLRSWCFWLFVAVNVIGLIFFYILNLPPTPPKDLLVVVANFEPIPSDDEKAKAHSETVAEDLKRMLIEKINSGVPLEYPIRYKHEIKGETEEEKSKEAKEIGIIKGAHLVLWGNVQFTEISGKGEFYLEPMITIVQPLGPTELEAKQPGGLRVSFSEPEIYELRRRKIEETTDIVSFIHGLAIFKQQKYENAINIFKGIRSPDAEVCFYHGTALALLSRFEEAINQFNKVIKINPRFVEAYYNRGNAYGKKGENDLAISDYKKTLEINPRDAMAFNNRGNAYARKGKYDLAFSDYKKALEINPRYAEAYYNRGLAYGKKGKYDLAIDDYNKALEINPRDAVTYNNRGTAYYGKGEDDRAISDYNKALEINPRDAVVYHNRGLAYGKKGEYGLAISDYKKVLEINPGYAKAFYNRAVAYYFKQEYGKAWDDVHSAQGLGFQVPPILLKALREASGRE